MKREEIAAVILGAVLIFAPLYAGETQALIQANRQSGCAQTPNPTAILAWLGFGVLLFQAWIAFRQTRISREQNDILAKQTLIQTETSRPHVFIVGVDIKPDGGAWLTLGTIWKNSGLTPPIKLNTAMQIDWIIGGFIPDDFSYELRTTWTEDVPLGVGREVVVDRIMIQEGDLLSADNFNRSWFLWGKANYTDNFSPGVIHRVEYCFRMRVQNGRPTFEESGPHNRTYDEKI